MVTIEEMASAHLLNVKREIQALNERKTAIDNELVKLTDYLREGSDEIARVSSTQAVIPSLPQNEAGSTVFSPSN